MPARSENQRRAAGAALSAKRKGSTKGLYGPSKKMYKSMNEKDLRDFAKKPVKPVKKQKKSDKKKRIQAKK